MYKTIIELDDSDLMQVLSAESAWDKDRSSVRIDKNRIIISAKDIIAFKATINGIIKIIEAYEKASSVTK